MKPIGHWKRFLKIFFGCLAYALLAKWLSGKPAGADEPISPGLWVALFMQFSFWIGSLHCWGSILLKSIGLRESKDPEHGLAIALGSLLYALIAFALGTLGLLHPLMSSVLWMFQGVGVALAGGGRVTISRSTALAYLPLGALLLLLFADALVISPYWDPLHHHLASVRLFWEHGRIYFPREAIASYQEGGFELLYLWPHFFFGEFLGRGLLPVQVFAQLTHLLVGYGGALLIAHSLARSWLPTLEWRALGVTLFAIPASLQLAIPTAKNDWGIVLWVLAGFLLLGNPSLNETRKGSSIRASTAGLLWGFAWLAKLSCVFSLLGLASLFLFSIKNARPRIGWVALGFLAGALPLAIRNLSGPGNPLFPLFPDLLQLGEFRLGPTWREALARYQANPIGLARFGELAQEFPLASGVVLLPLLSFRRKEPVTLRAAALGAPLGIFIFSYLAGSASELRLLGPLLPLMGLMIVVLVQRFSLWLPLPKQSIGWILLGLLTLALPYRWESARRVHLLPYNHMLTRAYISGEAQGWFRAHYRPGMRAALLSESRFYHSLPLPVIRIWDFPELDINLRSAADAPAFLQTLRNAGFTHLILSQEKLDLFYPKELVSRVESFVLQRPASFAFESKFSVVADLSKLP